jgi:hypothetical protein
VRVLYPTSLNDYAYAFSSGYVQRYRREVGTGYWEKFQSATTQTVTGLPITRDTLDVVIGWNMVGTITEAVDAARYATAHGYRVVGSGRAGGSIDDPIPDIAVAVGAPLVKFGAPRTGERLGKQNCLLRIEEEFGEAGRFAGQDLFRAS